jgi:hypothetical protein
MPTSWNQTGGLLGRILQALGINAVPIFGFFGEGWSPGTALAIYWVESVLVILFMSVRIGLHRRWTQKAGHYRGLAISRSSTGKRPTRAERGTTLGSGYRSVAIPFTAVHGLFLGLLLFLFLPKEFGPEAGVSLPDLGRGVAGVTLFLVIGLVTDVVGLRDRSFLWMESSVSRALGRIFVVHLTIIFGMFGAMFFHAPSALFAVFAALKTLVDLGSALPQPEPKLEPPSWLLFLDKKPKKDGETFSENWRRTELAARKLREENERTFSDRTGR